MRTSQFIALLTAIGIATTVAATSAAAGIMTASVVAHEPEGGNPSDSDDFFGIDLAGSLSAQVAQEGSSALARASVDFNYVGAEAFASGPGGVFGFPMQAVANAEFYDLIRAYDSFGVEVTEGSAIGYFRVDGSVNGNAQASFGWGIGTLGDSLQWGTVNANGPAISIDETIPFLVAIGASGLDVSLSLFTDARTDSTGATGSANFLSSGVLASIVYVNSLGIEDPTVQFRGTANNVYPSGSQPVPEPSSLLLMGMGLIGSCALSRRKRCSAA